MTKLQTKVAARNEVNTIARAYVAKCRLVLYPLVGQKILLSSGGVSAKFCKLSHSVELPISCYISTGHGYSVTANFRAAKTTDAGTFYAEATLYLFDIKTGCWSRTRRMTRTLTARTIAPIFAQRISFSLEKWLQICARTFKTPSAPCAPSERMTNRLHANLSFQTHDCKMPSFGPALRRLRVRPGKGLPPLRPDASPGHGPPEKVGTGLARGVLEKVEYALPSEVENAVAKRAARLWLPLYLFFFKIIYIRREQPRGRARPTRTAFPVLKNRV